MATLCALCLDPILPRPRDGKARIATRRYCSKACANKANGDARMLPIELRFWLEVPSRPNGDCWPWNGVRDRHGYGIHSKGRGGEGKIKAHRFSYILTNGPIPDGLLVRHACDNPSCVNPCHLEIGTHKDNAMDMVKRKRLNDRSLLNLRPGAKGFYGAGPISKKEILQNA